MPLNIFYLDDEPDLCEIFADYFSSDDVTITTFTDPKLAVEAINAHPPDMFFVDYRLSGTTGDNVAQSIDPNIPMFLISGELSPVTVHKFIKVISKPFNNDEIIEIFATYAQASSAK